MDNIVLKNMSGAIARASSSWAIRGLHSQIKTNKISSDFFLNTTII